MQCHFLHGLFGVLLLVDREVWTSSLDAQRFVSSMSSLRDGSHCNRFTPPSTISGETFPLFRVAGA